MPADLHQCFRLNPGDLPGAAVPLGRTAAMRVMQGRIARALESDLPVLLEEERGTGKDLIAGFLHSRSSRREKLATKHGKCLPQPKPAVLRALEEWNWPGNPCELGSCVVRVVILGDERGAAEEQRRLPAVAMMLDGHAAMSGCAKSASRHVARKAWISQALKASRVGRRKKAGELKRSCRLALYRFRIDGGFERAEEPQKISTSRASGRSFPRNGSGHG